MGLLFGLGRVLLMVFLDQLLLLFQHPPKSSRASLDGTLPLRSCSTRFARRVPTWSLTMPGHVAGLVCAGVGFAGDVEGEEVHWVVFQMLIVRGGVAISMMRESVLFLPGLV